MAADAMPVLGVATGSYDAMPPNAIVTAYIPTESARRSFVDGMAEVQVKLGEVIMRQGDRGNNFYVIKDGQCEVSVEERDGSSKVVRRLSPGSSCGELAILDNAPRSATVTAISATVTVLIVNRRVFLETVGAACRARRGKYCPFLRSVDVLAHCTDYELHLIADALVPRAFADGETVLRRDEPNERFWMVVEGRVRSDLPERLYGPGDSFGVLELFKAQRTPATFSAQGPCHLACMSREAFLINLPLTGILADSQSRARSLARASGASGAEGEGEGEGGGGGGGSGLKPRARRLGHTAEPTTDVVGAGADAELLMPAVRKSEGAQARIRRAVRGNILFNRLDAAQFDVLVDYMAEHSVPAGTVVIREGEKGNHFYVIDQGECDAFTSAVSANGGHVRTFRAGESFGELALMYNCPRTATLTARTDCVLWSLDRTSFRRVLLEENARKAKLHEQFLEKVPLLGPLSKAQRNRMVDALESAAAAPGEVIIAQGAEGTHFYVIDVGEVHISNRENGFLATRGPGDYFGEASLRTGAPTIATVTAHSACKLVRMDRGAFQRLLGPVNALLRMRSYNDVGQEVDDAPAGGPDAGRQAPAAVVASGSGEGVPRALAREKRAMSLAEFDCSEKVLGEGAFGKVRRALHRGTGQVYAIKEMGKAEVVASGQVEHILQESEVLGELNHPCIANKVCAFQTVSHLYLVLEYAPGGDLYDKLQSARQFSCEDSRLFIAHVLLALEHMHEKSFVHRDLKLENLLVTHDGAIKLTDFGFAKKVLYRTWTLCGTPEYLAPEIVLEKGHNKAADYWALGVLLYEFLSGRSPFEAEDHMATYKKILTGKVVYPKRMDAHGMALVGCLLQRDISRRFGNLKDGAADIKRHAFFKGFNWDQAINIRGSFTVEPESASSFTDWIRAEEICVLGAKLSTEDDSAFATFGR